MYRAVQQRIVYLMFTLALLCYVPIQGQVLKGSISGTVTDPQGAVISGADVKATNTTTNSSFTTKSDRAGLFRFSLIPAGTYRVEVTAKGFKTTAQNDIPVTAGRDSGLGTVALAVGDTGTTVEVTAATPLIESTQAQVTNTFTTETLSTFAGIQSNEGLDNLALFVPGVSSSRDNNFSNFNGGLGFSSNGLRGRNNDQQIDGQNNNDNSVAGPGVFLSDPNWVNQYVLITNNFGAEYGRNSGSVVNLITKGGTNNWHGSIYASENNSVLNAMTNFQKNFDTDAQGNPLTQPPQMNDIFSGIQAGGPLIKNRVFVAGGFNNETINVHNPFTSGGITPTPAGLATLSACPLSPAGMQALTALKQFGPFGVKGGSPIPSSSKLKDISDPVTSAVICPGVQFGTVTRTLSTPDHIYDFYGRTDIQLGQDSLVGRYLYNKNTAFNLDDGLQGAAAGYPFNEPALGQTALLSWTHNFGSRMVNELRGSYSRLNVEFGGNTIGTMPIAGELNTAPSNVIFNSSANLGWGPATNLPQQRIVNTWQGQDNWNYVLGKNTLRAGVNFTYQRSPNIFLPNINGQFRFGNWDDFFAGTPNRVRIANGPSSLDFREYDTFLYVADDYKVNRSLTVNLGVTWTYYGQPANLFNDITTTRESNPATAFWNPALPLSVRTDPRIPTPMHSIGPSIGFAWAPQWGGIFGSGKTVLRGGYRLSYDPPFYNIYLNMATSAPVTFLQSFTGSTAAALAVPAVPTGPNVRALLAPNLTPGVFDPRTQSQTNITPNFGPDRVHSWSFGLQQEVTRNSALEARYAGNKGINLFQSIDGNPFIADLQSQFPQFVPPGLTPCATTAQLPPFPISSVTHHPTPTDLGRVSCGPGVVRTRSNTGFSNYNALQVEYRATNLMKQLTMRLGYTFSKTLDNVSEIFSTGLAGNTVAFPQNPISPQKGEYSFSGLDYPNTFSILVAEQLPFFRDQHGFLGHTLGGWTLSANYLLQSGQRYTPAQASEVAAATASGNFFDAAFIGAFVGSDTARPFLGNSSAPVFSVGAFAGDACAALAVTGNEPVCSLPATQLVSINSLNNTAAGVNAVPTTVTSSQVRFIMNGGTAEGVFGTPFGNMPRNIVQDAKSNIVNASVSKKIKLSERMGFEFRASGINLFNHANFQSIDPFVEDAGLFSAGTGFGNPQVTDTVPGVIGFPGGPIQASRRFIFGGTITF